MNEAETKFFNALVDEVRPAPPPVLERAATVEPPPRQVTEKNLFSNPETSPVVLDFALLKQFKLDWTVWLPDTLWSEIERVFHTSIADVNKLKIQATQTLHVIDTFWEDWEIFEKTLHALNGQMPLVEVMQPPDLLTLYAGVDIASAVRREKFSEEVARYCAAVFLHENVLYAPEPLEFCQPYISQPRYHCNDCGKEGSAVPPWDGLCESCAGHYQQEHAFSLKPDPERVARGWGKNITLKLTYDYEPVKARFEQLNQLTGEKLVAEIHEVPEDIQSAKLISALDFLSFHRQQLTAQLQALRPWLESA